MRRRGLTLVELLIAGLLITVAGGALVGIFGMSFRVHDVVIGQNIAYSEARKGVDLMADHIRNAQLNKNTGSGVLNSVLHSGSLNDITYYTDEAGTQIRYRLNGTNLERTDDSVTTVSAADVQSLTLTYYKLTSYNGTWTQTIDPNAPTAAELPTIGGVEIRVSIAKDGYTTEYKSLVRLRNSPRKHKLSGI